MPITHYDLVIIGGGIHGCGIANDATGRGLSVALFEKNDLASATSSASSKLLHGGLRYLEQLQFKMVKNALQEREILLKIAPHLVIPMRFCLPIIPNMRSSYQIRIGLFLYDHLSKRATLPASKKITFTKNDPMQNYIKTGFEYSDGLLDDARIVVQNARLAKQRGAHIQTYAEIIKAQRQHGIWHIKVKYHHKEQILTSYGLVNTTGPWVNTTLEKCNLNTHNIRLVKGSHIIIPTLTKNKIYLLQNQDKRIIFVIPYQQQFSLVGTTDIDCNSPNPQITQPEINYLLNTINQYFKKKICKNDIIAHYTGVRTLTASNTAAQYANRDGIIKLDDEQGKTPLLTIIGGKFTTYRRLCQQAMNYLQPYYPQAIKHCTANIQLPGGNIVSVTHHMQNLLKDYPWMPTSMAERYTKTYGSDSHNILQNASSLKSLGENYGCYFTEAELEFLIQQEWVKTLEDAIYRRTKLYLFLNQHQKKHLQQAINTKI